MRFHWTTTHADQRHTNRHTQTYRQTQRHTETDRDRHTERQTDVRRCLLTSITQWWCGLAATRWSQST